MVNGPICPIKINSRACNAASKQSIYVKQQPRKTLFSEGMRRYLTMCSIASGSPRGTNLKGGGTCRAVEIDHFSQMPTMYRLFSWVSP